ncbi:MAG: hypothetical protein JOZ75_00640 [Candidatus Dormibacteraeota bacterium]|nr:hypothetical protein [Candidatus Dormibacteraeota bacterium]
MRPNVSIAIALVVLAVAFAGFAIFYWTTKTSLFASDYGIHSKHAILFTVLAVLSLIAANFARRSGAARAR